MGERQPNPLEPILRIDPLQEWYDLRDSALELVPIGVPSICWVSSIVLITLARLRSPLDRVWGDPSYRQNALRLQQAIASSGGMSSVVDIVQLRYCTRQPVL